MSQAPTPSKTPLTDDLVGRPRRTLKGSYEYMVIHARRLERDRARLMEALRDLELTVSQSYGLMNHAQTIRARALLKEPS